MLFSLPSCLPALCIIRPLSTIVASILRFDSLQVRTFLRWPLSASPKIHHSKIRFFWISLLNVESAEISRGECGLLPPDSRTEFPNINHRWRRSAKRFVKVKALEIHGFESGSEIGDQCRRSYESSAYLHFMGALLFVWLHQNPLGNRDTTFRQWSDDIIETLHGYLS